MLSHAGIGVAMGNASPSIQKVATMVTDTNDNDGIWKALKRNEGHLKNWAVCLKTNGPVFSLFDD